MKIILFSLFFISVGIMGSTEARAFYLQQSAELLSPVNSSPYPQVQGPALDILPPGFVTITVGDEVFYYCNGIFYQKIMRDQKYMIVPPPIGAVVFNIPQGYQYIFIDGVSFYVYQGIYYRRVLDGYRVTYPPV